MRTTIAAHENGPCREWHLEDQISARNWEGTPARVWIRLKTNHTISAHSDRVGSYERAIKKGWSRAYTIRNFRTGKEKKVKKHNFELYRNIRGPVTGGQFHEQRQFHCVEAKLGVLIQCLAQSFKQLLLSGNSA